MESVLGGNASLQEQNVYSSDIKSLDYIPILLKELPRASADNKTFYFELKDNIKWDDGSPLTVEDIVFSTKIMLCHLTDNSQIRPIYTSVIKSVSSIIKSANFPGSILPFSFSSKLAYAPK